MHAQLGKMRVYRSGKVKLRLGDVVFDMAQGIPSEVRPPMQLSPAVQPPCWGSHPSFPFCALFKLHGPDATHATGMRRPSEELFQWSCEVTAWDPLPPCTCRRYGRMQW